MFGLSVAVQGDCAKEPADMRKSGHGLATLVAGALELDPLSGHLFVFVTQRPDRIKILYWDRDGLAVGAKRLESGPFRVPQATAGRVPRTTADLATLRAGIDLNTARRRVRSTRPVTPLQNSEPLPASRPRTPVVPDVPLEQLPCPAGGVLGPGLDAAGREQREDVPASLLGIAPLRPKDACPVGAAQVVIAERLPEPLEKGLPGPGLRAQVMTHKQADPLPLSGQQGLLLRPGVEISRSTRGDGRAGAAEWLQPIGTLLRAKILESQVVQNDDTPVKGQDHEGQGIKTGRLWASLGDPNPPEGVYPSTPDRSGVGPAAIFQGFPGSLQAAASSASAGLSTPGKIIEVGCMRPARRKFSEARTSDPPGAHRALAWINLLSDSEREAKETSEAEGDEAFVAAGPVLRGERSRPIFQPFHAGLEAAASQVLPKSPISEAIGEAWNHWAARERALEVGFLERDQGACERGLKPVALGRRNWLFAGTDRGAGQRRS